MLCVVFWVENMFCCWLRLVEGGVWSGVWRVEWGVWSGGECDGVLVRCCEGVSLCCCVVVLVFWCVGCVAVFVCSVVVVVWRVGVLHTVPKRPLKILAGGARDAHWTGTNEDASVTSVISIQDAGLTYLHLKPYKCVPPRAHAVSGILQAVHDVLLNNTVGRLITFPLCNMTDYALQTTTWTLQSIIQVCFRRLISESHSMARLPV